MLNLKPIFIVFFIFIPSMLMASTGTVINVIDGDSVVVKISGEQFQADLIFVDAPEIDDQYGREAKQYVAERTKGKKLTIKDHGKFFKNNHLVEIFLPTGTSINRLLIENGYARYYTSIKSSDKLIRLEEEAKSKKIGIWGLEKKEGQIIYSDNRDEVLSHEGKAYYITKDKKYITKDQLKDLIQEEKNQSKILAEEKKGRNKESTSDDEDDMLSPCKAQCRSTFPHNNVARSACMSLCLY